MDLFYYHLDECNPTFNNRVLINTFNILKRKVNNTCPFSC